MVHETRKDVITDPIPESTQGSPRRLDIQGLRALAVLMVVAFHAGLNVPGAFVGVDVFFVISGFVITSMLQREWSLEGRINLKRFYWRRFKRLTPALACVVTATVVVAGIVLSPLGSQQQAAETGIGAILLLANVVLAYTTGGYFDAAAETNPLLNTWSLSSVGEGKRWKPSVQQVTMSTQPTAIALVIATDVSEMIHFERFSGKMECPGS